MFVSCSKGVWGVDSWKNLLTERVIFVAWCGVPRWSEVMGVFKLLSYDLSFVRGQIDL